MTEPRPHRGPYRRSAPPTWSAGRPRESRPDALTGWGELPMVIGPGRS